MPLPHSAYLLFSAWLVALPGTSGNEAEQPVAFLRAVENRRGHHRDNRLVGIVEAQLRATRHTLLIKRRGAHAASEDQPVCSCDCCGVVPRRPDEVVAGVGIKCAPSDSTNNDVCGYDQCAPDPRSSHVLQIVAEDPILDYQRFCFFECKPASGLVSPVESQCAVLQENEMKKLVDRSGNAIDPAIVYTGPLGGVPVYGQPVAGHPHASLLGARSMVSSSSGSVGPAPAPAPGGGPGDSAALAAAEAVALAGNARALGATEAAVKQAFDARLSEAFKAKKLNTELKSPGGRSVGPYGPIEDIHEAALATESSAVQASRAARGALEAADEAKDVNWRTALDTAESQMLKFRDDAIKKAQKQKQVELDAQSSWQWKAQRLAHRMSKPWLDAVTQSQTAVQQYGMRAQQAAAEANNLQKESEQIATMANKLKQEGRTDEADMLIYRAQDTMSKAQRMGEFARKMYKTAEDASGKIKMYYKGAVNAARIAADEVNLA